ncbi:hypothetical protein MTP99_017960 [Tenebrio molitor]|jgi:hypothetical protein|nr:hypothetical protein MTP99_017960 [Tenebrio molitor]
MNVHKQMCWCFEVFCGVLTNLTYRFFIELSDASYRMRSLCCCKRKQEANECGKCGTFKGLPERHFGDLGVVKDATEDFYKEVSRDAAENLLKNKQDGTFIIRPSKNCNLGTLSVVQDRKIFHLNVRRREDGMVALGTEKDNEKCFQDVNSLINYYISNYLVLYSRGVKTLTLLLPYREKTIC